MHYTISKVLHATHIVLAKVTINLCSISIVILQTAYILINVGIHLLEQGKSKI